MTPGDPTPNLARFKTYKAARSEFDRDVPDRFNLADAIFKRHYDAVTRVAVVESRPGGLNTYTFNALDYLSDKFAAVLGSANIVAGDRIAVILPQSAGQLIAQLGALKAGGIVVPLRELSDASRFAIHDSGARAIVIDQSSRRMLAEFEHDTTLETVFIAGESTAGPYIDFWRAIYSASSDISPVETTSASPGFVFYVERAGKQVGVVHTHRSMLGSLAAFEMTRKLDTSPGVVCSLQDWSEPAAAIGAVYPSLWYGCQLAAAELNRPTLGEIASLLERFEVTDLHLRCDQLNPLFLTQSLAHKEIPRKLASLVLDRMPEDSAQEVETRLFVTRPAASYQTPEAVGVIATCEVWFEPRGYGRRAPGHQVTILDGNGSIVVPGERGWLAIRSDDPALFSGYWKNGEVERSEMPGGWFLTGDSVREDEEGNLIRS